MTIYLQERGKIMNSKRVLTGVSILFVVALLAACSGGGGDAAAPAPPTYTVGGTVSGLGAGKSVVLQNNGGDSLTVSADGSFTFATTLANSATYSIAVSTQPASQTCTVTNGSSTISGANITNVSVACTTNTYTVGGTVSGLGAGKSVVLQNNGGNDLTVSAIGVFTFTTPAADGGAYAATVLTQPSGQTCAVTSGSGTVSGANVSNIAVVCSPWTRQFGTAFGDNAQAVATDAA